MSLDPNPIDYIAQNVRKPPMRRSLQAASRAAKHLDRLFSYGKNYLLYRLHEPLTIIVLGMHRSGTSFVTRAINLLGAHVGNHLLGRKEENPTGFWEHKLSLHINRDLLEMAGGRWDDPPDDVEAGPISKFKMKLFLAKLHKEGKTTAVWKDPRTLLTFPVWRREMVNYVPVFVFRHPAAVASSLQQRNGFTREKGLDLWLKYNRCLLNIDEDEEVSYFLNFSDDLSHISNVLKDISAEVGLEFNEEAEKFYDKKMAKKSELNVVKSEVRKVYCKLKSKSKR